MTLLREIMTGQALPVASRLQPEIGGRGTQTEQVTNIGLQLLAHAARGRLVAAFTGKILVTAVHRPAGMPALQTRHQQHHERQRTGCKAEDQTEILAKPSRHD